jgi:hypothetical protein
MKINAELSEEQSNQIRALIRKYKDIYQWSEYQAGLTQLTEHNIDTGEARPIKQRKYRIPQTKQDEVERQIQEMCPTT